MLTQLQRDAMDRAKRGDWSLADAMELLCDERKTFRDSSLLGGVRGHHRLVYFIYGDPHECDECEGSGEVVCNDCGGTALVDCPECNAEGFVTCPDCDGAHDGCDRCDDDGDIQCPKCEGACEVDCKECDDGKSECDVCNGLCHDPADDGTYDPEYIVDLNGRVLWSRYHDDEVDHESFHSVDFTVDHAKTVMHRYHNPPKPDPTPASPGVQTTFFAGEQAA